MLETDHQPCPQTEYIQSGECEKVSTRCPCIAKIIARGIESEVGEGLVLGKLGTWSEHVGQGLWSDLHPQVSAGVSLVDIQHRIFATSGIVDDR